MSVERAKPQAGPRRETAPPPTSARRALESGESLEEADAPQGPTHPPAPRSRGAASPQHPRPDGDGADPLPPDKEPVPQQSGPKGGSGSEEAVLNADGVGLKESVPLAEGGNQTGTAAERRAEAEAVERTGTSDQPERGGDVRGESEPIRTTPEHLPSGEETEARVWNVHAAARDIETLVQHFLKQSRKQDDKEEQKPAPRMAELPAVIESRLRRLEMRLRMNREG